MRQPTPLKYFGYLAIALYFALGLFFLLRPGALQGFSPKMQMGFGAFLLLYGGFRLWVAIQRSRYEKLRKNDENNEA